MVSAGRPRAGLLAFARCPKSVTWPRHDSRGAASTPLTVAAAESLSPSNLVGRPKCRQGHHPHPSCRISPSAGTDDEPEELEKLLRDCLLGDLEEWRPWSGTEADRTIYTVFEDQSSYGFNL